MTQPITFLITGANGWLGRQLISLLVSKSHTHPNLTFLNEVNLTIKALIEPHQMPPEQFKAIHNLHYIKGDIRDPNALKDFFESSEHSRLIHTAGMVHPKLWVRDFYSINVAGTQTLLKLARQHNLARTIVISSNSPIGCNPSPDHFFTEDSPYNPYMHYGKSKKKMEKFIHQFSALK